MTLENKIVIVTGGSGLIGKAVISHLQKNKAIVINVELNCTTDLDKGVYCCDVTSDVAVEGLISAVIDKWGRIDGLVNNAYPRTKDWGEKFENIKPESWKQNVDMQMNSVFFICQKVLLQMQQQQKGAIVNMGSIYGVVGNDFTVYEGYGGTSPAAYSAIKGGIINFTRYLASYYGRHGIRINCVSPGGVLDKQHPFFIEQYSAKVPLKRLAHPEEIAPAVAFLLSDDASYITGHNLMVDGGWTAI